MWQLTSRRALKGYYATVFMTFDVAEVRVQKGQKYPLKPLE